MLSSFGAAQGGMHNLSPGGEVEVEVGRGRIWGPPQTGQGAEKKLNQIRTAGPGEMSSGSLPLSSLLFGGPPPLPHLYLYLCFLRSR